MAVRRGLDDPVEGTDVAYVNRDMQACTAQKRDGAFCDAESLPDAPFPICLRHAAEVMRYLDARIPKTADDRLIAVANGVTQERKRRAPSEALSERKSVVYYLRVGALVKIGRTENLTARLRGYPPDAVILAVEPGGSSIEKRRHVQFAADLSHGNEWFRPSPALMQHINQLRAARAA